MNYSRENNMNISVLQTIRNNEQITILTINQNFNDLFDVLKEMIATISDKSEIHLNIQDSVELTPDDYQNLINIINDK
jgi:hypothetical protein